MERTAKYIEILRPPNRFTMYSGRVLTLGFALVRSYLRICHLAGDENWNEDKAKKLEQNESLGKKSLCWKAEKRFNFGLKATHIKLKSSNSEAWRCTSARQTFDNTQSKVPASSTAPTYEVFAANVTCKEGSSNLGVKSIYSSLTYMRAILHIILTGSQNKCLPSIVYVILSHRHPMSSWSSLGYLQGARTCVSRPRSSLRLCPGLASSLTAIQIEHHLSWWFTLTLWMNFEKMRKNMIGVLHRGRCQGQGWSREQQRRCLLHSTRCSIPPPPSSPASESSITKISKHRLGLYFGSPVAVSESTILSVHQCEVLVQARSTSLSQRQWRCSLSWPEVVWRLCSTIYQTEGINIKPWRGQLCPSRQTFTQFWQPLQRQKRLKGLSNVRQQPASLVRPWHNGTGRGQGRRFPTLLSSDRNTPPASTTRTTRSPNQSWPAQESRVTDRAGDEDQSASQFLDSLSLLHHFALKLWWTWVFTVFNCFHLPMISSLSRKRYHS